jgi:hypothetical protein
LAGIREAYGLAFFTKADAIDKALMDNKIDALNAVRNVIVHRSGIADAVYDRQSKFLSVPGARRGQPVELDGEIVMNLMQPVIVASLALVTAVDEWISEN